MSDPTVCLTVDFDAVSPWLSDPESNTPVNRSRGLFGANEGAPRLLDLFADREVPTTWFVPGHTIESFPAVCEAVVEAGHEVQHHGWTHTPPGAFESREAERDDLVRGIEAVESLTGERPTGYRSPSWDFSEHTVDLVADLGFEWSSNLMSREFSLFDLARDGAAVDDPYDAGDPVGITEVPVSWHRDDYPALAFSRNRGFADHESVFDGWFRQFEWMADHEPDGVFVFTMHPQVMGRSAHLARLAGLVDRMADRGASFERVGEVVAERT